MILLNCYEIKKNNWINEDKKEKDLENQEFKKKLRKIPNKNKDFKKCLLNYRWFKILISVVEQSESVIHICMSTLF